MFTTIAYYQSIDPAGVETKIAGVADATVKVVTNDVYVPALNRLMAVTPMVSTTVAVQYAKLDSPSLRRVSRYPIAGIQGAAAAVNLPADPPNIEVPHVGLPPLATNQAPDAVGH